MTSPPPKIQIPVWCREDSMKIVVFTNKRPGEGSVDLTFIGGVFLMGFGLPVISLKFCWDVG